MYILPTVIRECGYRSTGLRLFKQSSDVRSIINYGQKFFYSGGTGISDTDIEEARKWIQEFDSSKIPTSMFDISYSRSSGAGGQKVNKTSSKATVALSQYQWLNPQFCYWIPKAIRKQVKNNKIRYETKSGGLLIQSDSTRNRDTNTQECFRKLVEEIKSKTFFASEVSEEDIKKWDTIKEEAREKRLYHKKKNSERKKYRSKKFDL